MGFVCPSAMPATLVEYLELADWTGRIARPDKRGRIEATAPPVIRRLGLDEHQWLGQATSIEQRYWRAVGAVDALMDKARELGQCWLKGAGASAVRKLKQGA